MRAGLLVVVLAAGCAAPFNEVKPSSALAGVSVVYCGSAATSTQSVINSMEPPVGQVGGGDETLPEIKELNVCLRLENHGSETARLDRTMVILKTPKETDDPQADRDDAEVIAHPGEAKELHIIFKYTKLPSGEDVTLKLERAVKIGDKPVKLAPIGLRKS